MILCSLAKNLAENIQLPGGPNERGLREFTHGMKSRKNGRKTWSRKINFGALSLNRFVSGFGFCIADMFMSTSIEIKARELLLNPFRSSDGPQYQVAPHPARPLAYPT